VAVCPESAPHTGAQLLPDWVRLQVTPWFRGSLATVAVNCRAVETFNEELVGEIVTDTDDVDVTVTVAVADLVLFRDRGRCQCHRRRAGDITWRPVGNCHSRRARSCRERSASTAGASGASKRPDHSAISPVSSNRGRKLLRASADLNARTRGRHAHGDVRLRGASWCVHESNETQRQHRCRCEFRY
jgi:hypothetical protein